MLNSFEYGKEAALYLSKCGFSNVPCENSASQKRFAHVGEEHG